MTEEADQKINLLGLDKKKLESLFDCMGEPRYRAHQVLKWIHAEGVRDFDLMLNLSKALRQKLKLIATIDVPEILKMQVSEDGTQKWLFSVLGGSAIEAVLIPEEDRATLCVSCQVGCMLNCRFCHTGRQGFHRNLSVDEIIGQLWVATHGLGSQGDLETKRKAITNVVFMGMGEPLLNYDNVLSAIHIMQDDLAYGLAKKRITVSTAGFVPKIDQLAKDTDVSLALSLHAPDDALRTQLMPLNKKYPIETVLAACLRYIEAGKRRILTVEYVMLKGVNDSPLHAKKLLKLLRNLPVKINLIPFNPFIGSEYSRSDNATVLAFQEILMNGGIITLTRKTRGDDISAACGQLAGQVRDRTMRSYRLSQEAQPSC
ncbi:MAG TPA: 23S rRNA (adenine(2503)-C(2))-methyltransferase RlmN [Gammaproteobacteria bacterium]|nr:23S rRNA (adenine(2503)-C(2))-methyltransferase RlmN [Gammaproteobacteria bacterium]